MSAEEQVRLDNFDSIFSLDGKVAVVTGGSRGLGLHAARWEESLDTLALLHGHGDRNHPEVQVEWEEVQEAVRIAREAKDVSLFALLGPRVWKRTMCGVSVQVWQQLLGGNVAMYYVVYIFQMANMVNLFLLLPDVYLGDRLADMFLAR